MQPDLSLIDTRTWKVETVLARAPAATFRDTLLSLAACVSRAPRIGLRGYDLDG